MTNWVPKIEQEYGISIKKWESCASDPLSGESYKLCDINGREYFLKAHTKEINLLEQELKLVENLRSSGFILIPQSIPTTNGNLVCQIENRLYSLSSFVNGDPSYDWMGGAWTASQAYQAGETLAFFHACGKKISEKEKVVSGTTNLFAGLPSQLKQALASLKERSSAADSCTADILQHEVTLTAKLAETRSVLAGTTQNTATNTIIHGDFHPGNIIFSGEKVVALLDFEYAGQGDSQYDLAYGIIMFRDTKTLPTMEALLGSRSVGAFLKGYAHQGGLIQQDILRAWIKLAAFVIFAWLIDRLYLDKGSPVPKESIRWLLSFLSSGG